MLQRLQLATFLATGFSFGIVPLFFLLFFPWLVVAGQRHSIVYGLHGHTEPGSASEMFVVGKYQLLEPKRPGRWGPKGHHLRVGLGGYLTRGLWGSGYHPKGPVGPARCCPGTLSWPRRQEWVALFFSMHPNFDCCCCCCFVTDRVFLSWVFFFYWPDLCMCVSLVSWMYQRFVHHRVSLCYAFSSYLSGYSRINRLLFAQHIFEWGDGMYWECIYDTFVHLLFPELFTVDQMEYFRFFFLLCLFG